MKIIIGYTLHNYIRFKACLLQEVIDNKGRLYLVTFVDFTSGGAIAKISISIRRIVRAIYFFTLSFYSKQYPLDICLNRTCIPILII
jgi:hypothetical protein